MKGTENAYLLTDKGMESGNREKRGLSSFSVILTMMVFMVAGAAVLPLLNIQYSPKEEMTSLSAHVSFPNASARIVESEVTSKVEGALSSLGGVTNVNASSSAGGGYVNITFKKGTDMKAVRFDAATRLRQLRKSLPDGASVSLSGSVSGRESYNSTMLIYNINADMPANGIVSYAEKHILTPLSRIEGVESVSTSGATPYEWVVTFDPNSLRAAGLTPSDLSNAFGQHFQNNIVGTQVNGDDMMLIRLRSTGLNCRLEEIPVSSVSGRIFYVGDFATVRYKEQQANSYRRINGQNTIDIYVNASEGINTINVAAQVRARMEELEKSFPENFTVRMVYDASEHLNNEIQKIFIRAILSLLFLLLFVLLVSRSFRYLAVIGLTITANILSAVIFYWLFDIDIELYSMAGITVSLGIIIDTAIVMADHFTYYRNRKVMTSIAGALLTTIAALLIIFFLPENARADLTGFVWVIIINLTLSMAVAFFFVPALLDKIPLQSKGVARHSMRTKRMVVRWSEWYGQYIVWSRAHRWIFIVLMVWMFGLPIHLLPSQVHHKENYNDTKGGLVGVYNKTIGSPWYQKNRRIFEYTLGGAFNLFSNNVGSGSFYREPEEELQKQLYVNAWMAEGCTAQQMNEIIREMENWLNQFDGIEIFESSVGGNYGDITITFEKEAGRTHFPYELKQQLWAKAMGYGGATWYVSSLDHNDNSLSNSTYRSGWNNTISLRGYNYDILYRYAEQLRDTLLSKKRISAAEISGQWGQMPESEFYLEMDRRKIAARGLDVNRYFNYLTEQLYDSGAGSVFDGEKDVPVRIVSAEKDYYDLWHINNDMIDIDSTKLSLSDIGSITKRRTGVQITRQNQEYVISIGYDFIGSYELSGRMREQVAKQFNSMLPIGFHVESDDDGWWSSEDRRQQTLLLFIVVVIIFMICATMFESLKKPLSIIAMIPLGFVGLFLAFPVFRVTFDQGGFAAMVMLSGIVVNAGIYLISEYNTVTSSRHTGSTTDERLAIRYWVKAYNRKIIPTLLTIVSTILGLIPFLLDGKEESFFWYAFAIGVIGGMIFSIIALIFFMPVFVSLKQKTGMQNQ